MTNGLPQSLVAPSQWHEGGGS